MGAKSTGCANKKEENKTEKRKKKPDSLMSEIIGDEKKKSLGGKRMTLVLTHVRACKHIVYVEL